MNRTCKHKFEAEPVASEQRVPRGLSTAPPILSLGTTQESSAPSLALSAVTQMVLGHFSYLKSILEFDIIQ
jgi:hypothetical protein